MLDWLKRRFRKRPGRPHFVVTIINDTVRVTADWPAMAGLTDQQLNDTGESMAAVVQILTSGEGSGLALFQQAIGTNAGLRGEEQFGVFVSRLLNAVTESRAARRARDELSRPTMRPTEVLPPSQGGDR
jgi:hypothetical protein